MGNNKITLYPSNWLYNAGVPGLLRIIESCKKNALEFNGVLQDQTIQNKLLKRNFEVYYGK